MLLLVSLCEQSTVFSFYSFPQGCMFRPIKAFKAIFKLINIILINKYAYFEQNC